MTSDGGESIEEGAAWLNWLVKWLPKGPRRVSKGTSEMVNANVSFTTMARTRRAAMRDMLISEETDGAGGKVDGNNI